MHKQKKDDKNEKFIWTSKYSFILFVRSSHAFITFCNDVFDCTPYILQEI